MNRQQAIQKATATGVLRVNNWVYQRIKIISFGHEENVWEQKKLSSISEAKRFTRNHCKANHCICVALNKRERLPKLN